MKRKYLLIAFFILAGHVVAAQNVGIGISSPSGKLQINHRAVDASPTLNLVDSVVGDAPLLRLSNINTASYFQIWGNLSTSALNSYLDFMYLPVTGYVMSIRGDGNVGIGDVIPGERLSVAGNIRLSGKLTRLSTSTTNLVPIAFGNIDAAGFLNPDNSGNFSVSKITTGWYAITITAESYQFQTYTTVVTPAGSSVPTIVGTGSGGGNLYVYTYNAAGVPTDSQFCFVVYKH